ncbi:MAG: hypothetical protein ACREUN_02480 [Burkholderiales bacterium]
MLAPQVIALRSLRTQDRREMQRMSTEKVQAYWESMNAMALASTRYWWTAWASPWSAAANATRILEQGMVPVHRRAKANARRLSRVRKRR